MLKYKIITRDLGNEKIPLLEIEEPFDVLEQISLDQLSRIENVEIELKRINDFLTNKIDECLVGCGEFCIIKVEKEKALVMDLYKKKHVGNISTQELLTLLNEWKAYLENFYKK